MLWTTLPPLVDIIFCAAHPECGDELPCVVPMSLPTLMLPGDEVGVVDVGLSVRGDEIVPSSAISYGLGGRRDARMLER